MSRCRSCDAPVRFVQSATSDKRLILDFTPTKGIVLFDEILGDFSTPLGEGKGRVVDVYTDHHVTCPDAASWKGQHR